MTLTPHEEAEAPEQLDTPSKPKKKTKTPPQKGQVRRTPKSSYQSGEEGKQAEDKKPRKKTKAESQDGQIQQPPETPDQDAEGEDFWSNF